MTVISSTTSAGGDSKQGRTPSPVNTFSMSRPLDRGRVPVPYAMAGRRPPLYRSLLTSSGHKGGRAIPQMPLSQTASASATTSKVPVPKPAAKGLPHFTSRPASGASGNGKRTLTEAPVSTGLPGRPSSYRDASSQTGPDLTALDRYAEDLRNILER